MQEEKTIIHVTANLGGGVWSVIKNLMEYQLQKGYKVGLMCPDYLIDSKKKLFNELSTKLIIIPVETTHIKGTTQILGMPIKETFNALQKENDKRNIIFHAHNTAAIGLLRSIKNLPLICSIHGVNPGGSFISKIITFLILKKLIHYNYQITAVSASVSKHYNNLLRNNKISTVLNGAKINQENKLKKNKKFTIGFVGYIDDLKGWRYVLEAYNLLEDEYISNVNLILAGSGPEKDVRELNRLIEVYRLENNVRYLGQVEDASNNLMPYLDLLILPSKSEGLPMTLIEALGNGVPILATEVGGIPEVLSDGYNGYFIKRNFVDIANKIKLIYDDKLLYKKLSLNSYQYYNSEFTNEKMNEQYLFFYNRGR